MKRTAGRPLPSRRIPASHALIFGVLISACGFVELFLLVNTLGRTNASLGHKRRIDPKVAADQRGHGLGVSIDVYTQSDLEQKLAAVRALEVAVIQ